MSLLDYFIDIVDKDLLTYSKQTKICVYCHIEKHISQFPKHIAHKDNYDTRCRECKRNAEKTVDKLRKIAPPKSKVCDCCGEVPIKWVLDHNHKTKKFRGWICEPCNLGLGKFGDSLIKMKKAVEYLKRTEK